MKKLYLAIALIIAIPISLLSKDKLGADNLKPQNQVVTSISKEANLLLNNHSKNKLKFPSVLGKYNIIDTAVDIVFNGYYGNSTTLTYEPISGSLFMIKSNRYTDSSTGVKMLKGETILYYSYDKGASWGSKIIFEKLGGVPVDPSISVLNPKKSTNPNELFITIYNRYFKYNAFTKSYDDVGGIYLFNEGNGLDNQFDFSEETGPSNSGGAYTWSLNKSLSYNGPESSTSYFYGTLNANEGQQYGLYGFSGIEFDQNGLLNNFSIMPQEWGAQNWKTSDNLKATYNASIYIDADENGTLYMAVDNIFADDLNKRVLGISKSTDNGQTWSEFEKFPQAVLDNYLTQEGIEGVVEVYPYFAGGNGFAVTGVDEYTYLMAGLKIISNSAELYSGRFVELYKKNGEWKIRDVAPNTADKWTPPYVIQDTSAAGSTTFEDGFQKNIRGYEIQLAKTADGQSLLMKYIDNRNDIVGLNQPFTLCGGNVQVDSMLTTDVWVTYRDIANDNGWSTPANITDDIWMNRSTWIPSIIPSLTQVPIVEQMSIEFKNPNYPRVVNKYPYFVQNYVIDQGIPNIMLCATFDATKGENIRNSALQIPKGANGVGSVEDQINTEINSFVIYPNPVSNTASLSYDIANPSYVKIEVFNAMGELVKTVRNYSLATPGISGMDFDVNNLSAGVYYVTMTANGKKLTKMMNVVR